MQRWAPLPADRSGEQWYPDGACSTPDALRFAIRGCAFQEFSQGHRSLSARASRWVAPPLQKLTTAVAPHGYNPAVLPDLRERYSDQPALISTLRSGLIASGFFGSVTVSTPLLKLAPILSASTPDGSENERWKAP